MDLIIGIVFFYVITVGITYLFRNKIKLPTWEWVQYLISPEDCISKKDFISKRTKFTMQWFIVMLFTAAFASILKIVLLFV